MEKVVNNNLNWYLSIKAEEKIPEVSSKYKNHLAIYYHSSLYIRYQNGYLIVAPEEGDDVFFNIVLSNLTFLQK